MFVYWIYGIYIYRSGSDTMGPGHDGTYGRGPDGATRQRPGDPAGNKGMIWADGVVFGKGDKNKKKIAPN